MALENCTHYVYYCHYAGSYQAIVGHKIHTRRLRQRRHRLVCCSCRQALPFVFAVIEFSFIYFILPIFAQWLWWNMSTFDLAANSCVVIVVFLLYYLHFLFFFTTWSCTTTLKVYLKQSAPVCWLPFSSTFTPYTAPKRQLWNEVQWRCRNLEFFIDGR